MRELKQSDFVWYNVYFNYPEKKTWTTLRGVKSDRPGYIVPLIDFNTFGKEIKIPHHVEKKRWSWDHIKKYWYNPDIKRATRRRLPTRPHHKYFLHDNGGRPFLVYDFFEQKEVKIYKPADNEHVHQDQWSDKDEDNEGFYKQLVYSHKNYNKLFVGKDPNDDWFDGNSILIHLKDKEYVFAGWDVYQFTAPSEIKRYVSWVAISDVPEPVAIGKNFIIMMTEKSITKGKFLGKSDSDVIEWIKNEYEKSDSLKNVNVIQEREF